MEIDCFLHLCMPQRYGGYHLTPPELNGVVDTGHDETLEADLLWRTQSLVVEYHGEGSHATRAGMRRDAIRSNAYVNAGFTVITITNEHFENLELLHSATQSIARVLKKRIRLPHDFRIKQMQLRKELIEARRIVS